MRFTIRGMLLLVAGVAIALGGVRAFGLMGTLDLLILACFFALLLAMYAATIRGLAPLVAEAIQGRDDEQAGPP